jgi:hypothetical protein
VVVGRPRNLVIKRSLEIIKFDLYVLFPGALPLRGSIPDMTSDSERYIQLQNVYKSQANTDVDVVSNYVQNLLESIGRVKHIDII